MWKIKKMQNTSLTHMLRKLGNCDFSLHKAHYKRNIYILIISSLDSLSVQYTASTAHSRRKETWAARRQEES